MQTVDLERLEADLIGEVRPRLPPPVSYAPPHHRPTGLPDYVQHKEGVGQLGTLSAEAVVQQYEIAAREVEAMGAEMKRVAARCEDIMAQAADAIKHCEEVAAGYRADAKKVFEDLENYALLTQDVTRTCQSIRQKIVEHVNTA